MLARNLLFAFTVSIASLAIVPTFVRAEDTPQQEIENSKFQAVGSINSNAVYIRSGASENDYPTMKLDRGQQITVVGIRGDWLKIAPPDGSYCYVAKAYVDRRGDGTVGRVTNPLNVRVGSTLNAMKTKVASKLDNGDDVKILGEQDEYFKIAPPKDVYLYVNKQFVDLVRTAKAGEPAGGTTPTTPTPAPAPPDNLVNNTTPPTPVAPTPTQPDQSAQSPQDQASTPAPEDVASKPSTQPTNTDQAIATPTTKPADTESDAESQFDQLEKTFIESDKKTIDQQPLAELQAGYEKLIAGNALPESLRRMCDYRLATIKQRAIDQQAYIAVKKSQEEMKARQVALQAEREELETRIKNSGVKYFTAIGTLRVRASSKAGERCIA